MKIKVNPHKVEIIKKETEPVNEKEINISKCIFEFDEEIPEDFVKEAYFTLNDKTYKQIIANNECDLPPEILEKKGTLEIGIVPFKVENEKTIKRYNPSPDYFETWLGSLKGNAENSKPITPSEMQQFEQILNDGLNGVNDELEEVKKIGQKTEIQGDYAKKKADELQNKADNGDFDGVGLEFNWNNTFLGVKREDEEEYKYMDLKGEKADIQYATFNIDIETGCLIQTTTENFNNLNFSISENGNLEVNIYG